MAKIFNRFYAKITAQAVIATAADTLSSSTGQTALVVDTASGNLEGANKALVQLSVTVAPTTATRVELHIEESVDGGTTYTASKKIATFNGVAIAAGAYSVWIYDLPSDFKLQFKPIGYALTADLSISATYPETV